jgi:hypothetical protein
MRPPQKTAVVMPSPWVLASVRGAFGNVAFLDRSQCYITGTILWIWPLLLSPFVMAGIFFRYGSDMGTFQSGTLVTATVGFCIWCVVRYRRTVPRYSLKHLQKTGIQGTARALFVPQLMDSSSVLSRDIDLHVELPDRAPYVVKTNVLVDLEPLSVLRTQSLPVWVDPDNKNKLFIDWDALPSQEEQARQRHYELLDQDRQDPTDRSFAGSMPRWPTINAESHSTPRRFVEV